MKVYIFYLLEIIEKNNETTSELYAITNKKKYAKRFMEERDMSKFYMKKTSMEYDEYREFVNNSGAQGHELTIASLTTSNVDKDGIVGTRKVKVLLTNYESDVCMTGDPFMEICSPSFWVDTIKYTGFKKELIEALKLLQYDRFYKLFRDQYIPGLGDPPLVEIDPKTGLYVFPEDREFIPEPTIDEEIDIDYDAPDIPADQLSVFVTNFHRTFKKD